MTREAVRALLNRDRPWAVYALGDLSPQAFPQCEWWQTGDALGLLYRGYHTPILWASGQVDIPFDEPTVILQIREEMLPAIRAIYPQVEVKRMLRMALQGTPNLSTAERLTATHLPAVESLYAAPDGPIFFHAAMLDDCIFYGAWHDDQLIATAGAHVLNIEESAAAIGNVYTHPAHRGQGHASRLTAAIACELRLLGIQTIALSVAIDNAPAISIYTRLGFQPHCEFYQGTASMDGEKRLDALAKRSKRSKSFLATEATTAFVDSEEWQLGEIHKGIGELNSGLAVGHEKASKWLRIRSKTQNALQSASSPYEGGCFRPGYGRTA